MKTLKINFALALVLALVMYLAPTSLQAQPRQQRGYQHGYDDTYQKRHQNHRDTHKKMKQRSYPHRHFAPMPPPRGRHHMTHRKHVKHHQGWGYAGRRHHRCDR